MAPMSSSSTTGSSGLLEWRTKCHHDCSPLAWADSLIAVRREKASATMATVRIPMAQAADSISWGWRIFSMPS